MRGAAPGHRQSGPRIPDVSRWRRRGAGMVVAAVAVVVPAGGASPAQPEGTADIPVRGTFEVQQSRESGQPVARGAIHGVRRIKDATVLYFSLGYPERYTTAVQFFGATRRVLPDDRWGTEAGWATPYLVDLAGRNAYTAIVTEEKGNCVCSSFRTSEDVAGKLFVLYEVLPALPPDVKTVDVAIGFDTVVHDVPVEEGELTPTMDPGGPIVLGDGWPAIDMAAVASAPAKEKSIYPLQTQVQDLAAQVTTVETPKEVSLELATDVLFAVNSAVLTPAAQKTIATAAETVNQRSKGGSIAVVGHTDDTGPDSRNDPLSQQRAEAVRAALAPLVQLPGVSYEVSGKGEREPVDDNGTEAGRQRNRRVTVTFTSKGN